MREILFKGKSFEDRQWVDGTYVEFKKGFAYIMKNFTDVVKVIPETVGQFAGMTDKNKTKIFEGDIIKFGINQRLMYVHWNEETLTWELTDVGVSTCEVNHLLNTFDLGEIQVETAYGEMFSEVVGNIHDNPELLNT